MESILISQMSFFFWKYDVMDYWVDVMSICFILKLYKKDSKATQILCRQKLLSYDWERSAQVKAKRTGSCILQSSSAFEQSMVGEAA